MTKITESFTAFNQRLPRPLSQVVVEYTFDTKRKGFASGQFMNGVFLFDNVHPTNGYQLHGWRYVKEK